MIDSAGRLHFEGPIKSLIRVPGKKEVSRIFF